MASLKELLAELNNPAPKVLFTDPEQLESDTNAAIVSAVDDAELGIDANQNEFGNIRKKTAITNDFDKSGKYSGSKVSRKSLQEWNDEGNLLINISVIVAASSNRTEQENCSF